MTNTNCLEGIKCPRCGNEDAFYIDAIVLAYVTDGGAQPANNSNFNWDRDSFARCPECDYAGDLWDFMRPTVVTAG
jgi:hypothetical protein